VASPTRRITLARMSIDPPRGPKRTRPHPNPFLRFGNAWTRKVTYSAPFPDPPVDTLWTRSGHSYSYLELGRERLSVQVSMGSAP
jgi:hypothetical protein